MKSGRFRWFGWVWRLCRAGMLLVGLATVAVVALCFTSAPWQAYRWLATDAEQLSEPPAYIVVLGGGGIPSESGLVRTYHGAEAAREFPHATCIVALPAEGDLETSEAGKMKRELVMRGIEPTRIVIEPHGLNTRAQAQALAERLGSTNRRRPVLLVTSPYHMRRSLMCFRKVGFEQVAGSAAYPEYVKVDMRYDDNHLGGRSLLLPDVGGSLMLRYTFWNNVDYLGASLREACALAYYKLRGWI